MVGQRAALRRVVSRFDGVGSGWRGRVTQVDVHAGSGRGHCRNHWNHWDYWDYWDHWNHSRRPVHRRFVDQPHAPRLLGAEVRAGHGVVQHRQAGALCGQLGARRCGAHQGAVHLPRQQVDVQLARRQVLQRFGMCRHQLAEEVAALGLGPADQVHACCQFLHQAGQLGQEGLAGDGRCLGLHAHEQLAAGQAQALCQRAVCAACAVCAVCAASAALLAGLQQHPAPRAHQEIAHEFRSGQAFQVAFQALRIKLAQALFVFLLRQQFGGQALRVGVLARQVGHEGLQRAQLPLVGLDLVEITVHDLLDQVLHLGQEALAAGSVEVVEACTQRRNPVDETAHRVPARRKERAVPQRGSQHRELQAPDLACDLRRHLGVGQDLVEEAGDDVDDQVVQRPRAGLAQCLAVRMDQVGHRRHGPRAAGGEVDMALLAVAVGCAGHASGQRVVPAVGKLGRAERRQPANQRHQRRIDLTQRPAAASAAVGGRAEAAAALAPSCRRAAGGGPAGGVVQPG